MLNSFTDGLSFFIFILAVWLHVYCLDMEVWLRTLHGSNYCHPQWWWDDLYQTVTSILTYCTSHQDRPTMVLNLIYFVIPFIGTIMTISKDRVKPSPQPDSWKLKEIFCTGIVLGGYLALMTVLFFWAMHDTDFFTVRIAVVMSHWLYYFGEVSYSFAKVSFSKYFRTSLVLDHWGVVIKRWWQLYTFKLVLWARPSFLSHGPAAGPTLNVPDFY